MTKSEEIVLIEKIRRGNYEAETRLFSRFDERVVRKIRIALGVQNDEWQDVVSEVKLALLRNLRDGKFDLNRGVSLGSYVFGITMNKIRDYYKHHKKQEYVAAEHAEQHLNPNSQESEPEKAERRDVLKKLLRNLNLKYKEVLYLRYYEELSVAQISQKINLPPRRVSERLNYALKLLKKECEKKKYFSIFSCIPLITI